MILCTDTLYASLPFYMAHSRMISFYHLSLKSLSVRVVSSHGERPPGTQGEMMPNVKCQMSNVVVIYLGLTVQNG